MSSRAPDPDPAPGSAGPGWGGDEPTGLDRRAFVRSLPAIAGIAGGALGWSCGGTAPRSEDRTRGASTQGSPNRRLEAIGVQLYTVRASMADDVPGTLAALSGIGYREVELAGLYGLTPAQMRLRLDDTGLRAVSSHVSIADVRTGWEQVIDDSRLLGVDWVVVPSLPGDERDPESLRRIADELSWAGEVARSSGFRFGYHNHDWELVPLPEGPRPIDLLLERTQADLVDWQMDVFWTVHGGGDPSAYLRRVGDRVTTFHVKDRSPDGRMVDVGDGAIDFAALIGQGLGAALTHVFVEHDRPDDALESVRRSFRHLTTIVELDG